MPDSIIFLGTGKGGIVAGKQLRATGGILLQSSGSQLILDPGPGSLVKLNDYNVNLRDTSAILVSHHHNTHSSDINALIDAITFSGLDKRCNLISTATVINGDENHIPSVTPYHRNMFERISVLQPGKRASVNNIEIIALPTKHSNDNIGFKLITNNFTLVYSSDTKYDKEVIASYKDADILILNVAEQKESDNNLTAIDAEKIIEKVSPKLAILTHFGVSMLNSDPLQITRDIQKNTNIQTIAAKDGMILTPANYAAKSKQRNLGAFR